MCVCVSMGVCMCVYECVCVSMGVYECVHECVCMCEYGCVHV